MKLSLSLLVAAALCSSILKADLIYSNFGANHAFTAGVGLTPGYSAVASSFTPGARYALDSLSAAAFRVGPDTPDSVVFSVYSGAAGLPLSALESFTLSGLSYAAGESDGTSYPALTINSGILTASSLVHPVLEGGQQYWLVMSGVNPGDVTWNSDGNGVEGAATLIAPDILNEVPAHWSALGNYAQGAFEIQGTLLPGPEPATFLMLGSGLVGIVIRERKRFKR